MKHQLRLWVLFVATMLLAPVASAQSRPQLALQTGHRGAIHCVAFSPDDQTIATGGGDQTVKLWEVKSGALKQTLKQTTGQSHPLSALAFSPNGKTLASAGYSAGSNHERSCSSLKLWNLETGWLKKILIDSQPDSMLSSVAFSPDGRLVAAGGGVEESGVQWFKGAIRVWDVQTGKLRRTFKLPQKGDGDCAVVFSRDGKVIACSWQDKITFWNLQTGKLARTLPLEGRLLGFSRDGSLLITDRAVWNLKTNRAQWQVQGMSFFDDLCADGTKIVEGSSKIRSVANGKILKTLVQPDEDAFDSPAPEENDIDSEFASPILALSRDGTYVAQSGSQKGALDLRFWNITTGRIWKTTAARAQDFSALPMLGFIAGGQKLTSAFQEWDLKNGRLAWVAPAALKEKLKDEFGELDYAVRFSPDGKTYLDGAGVLQDFKTQKQLLALRSELANFSPDGRLLITGKSVSAKNGKPPTFQN